MLHAVPINFLGMLPVHRSISSLFERNHGLVIFVKDPEIKIHVTKKKHGKSDHNKN